MNLLTQHIEYLLLRKDCVILPTIGAFLAQDTAARIAQNGNPARAEILAPERTFCFNGDITDNDGTLISSVAKSKGISYEKAADIVAKECNAIRSYAINGGEVAIGKIGSLIYNEKASAFTFKSLSSSAPTTFSPWLSSVKATLIDTNDIDSESRYSIDKKTQKAIKESFAKRFARVAACIILLIGLGITLSTPISIDNATLASLSVPKVSKIDTSELLPTSMENMEHQLTLAISTNESFADIESDSDKRANYRMQLKQLKEYHATNAYTNAVSTPSMHEFSSSDSQSYCVIVASLASLSEAQSYIAKNGAGCQLNILPVNGKYRIYCATSDTSAEAWRIASSVSSRFPGAWVCTR